MVLFKNSRLWFCIKTIFFLKFFCCKIVACTRQINIHFLIFYLNYWKHPKNYADHYAEHPVYVHTVTYIYAHTSKF